MALTYSAACALLRVICGKSSSSPYTQVYLGLSTTTPNRGGTGYTEPVGASYERQVLGNASVAAQQKMGEPGSSTGSITNNNSSNEYGGKIYFPELGQSESWGTVTHVCIFSAKTGGTLLAYAALPSSITPTGGSVPMVPASSLTFSLT